MLPKHLDQPHTFQHGKTDGFRFGFPFGEKLHVGGFAEVTGLPRRKFERNFGFPESWLFRIRNLLLPLQYSNRIS